MITEKKKIGIIFGTRPEIIKLAPIILKCQEDDIPFFCIHSGQHYSKEMDQIFFETLGLPDPKYRLDVGKRGLVGHGVTTGAMMADIESIFLIEKPDIIFVQGDTNTAFAGAVVAAKIPQTSGGKPIKVAHVEAGLRSYDRRMPEEVNRIMIDHISDFLFVPTEIQRQILLSEGKKDEQIHIVGNTIVDAVTKFIGSEAKRSNILEALGLQQNSYILMTLHRQENVDTKEVLSDIIKGLDSIYSESNLPIIFSAHPRTEKRLLEFGISLPSGIKPIKPVGYLDFLTLEANAKITMTDSGGVQEESCILGIPCVTLRDTTERPETVNVGANSVAGTNPENILNSYNEMINKERNWKNPFGDGRAAEIIIDIVMN